MSNALSVQAQSVAKTLGLAALLVSGAALAVGATTGRIRGFIYDTEGNPAAGASVTLRSSRLLQPEVVQVRADGSYELDNLPPGEDFELEVVAAGMSPVRQRKIRVRVGQTTPIDLLVGELSENLTVTAAIERPNPVNNPDTAQTGAVITAEKAAATPIFNQVEGMTQLAPGVGPGTRPSTRGGFARYTKFYVDGMDTTDISDGSITAPMNFYSVENFEVVTGGFDAQYNSMGAVENIVSKSGGNEFTYDMQLILSPDWMNARARAASNNPALVGTFTEPSTVREAQTSFYAPHLNVGGPIIKDRLWFYGSAQMNLSSRENFLTFRDGSTEARPTDTATRLARLKLTWQPTEEDRLSVAFNYDHNTIDNLINSSSFTRDAENRIDRGGFFFIVNYDRRLTQDLSFQLQSGTTLKNVNTEPSSGTDAASHRDLNTGLTTLQGSSIRLVSGAFIPGNYLREFKQRWQFDPTLTLRAEMLGTHKIKGGVQISYLQSRNDTGVIGRYRYVDRGGVCNESDPATFSFCNQRQSFFNLDGEEENLTTNSSNLNIGAFIQDRWFVNKHLTLIPGFRFDTGQLYGDTGKLGQTLIGYGPRLSATWDVFGDVKTLVTAHYGRSNDMGDVFISQRGNPELYTVTATWNAGMQVFPACTPEPMMNPAGCSITGGPAGRVWGAGTTPPHIDEVALGIKQEVAEETALGVDFTYRKYSNLWVEEEVNRIWDVTGTRVVGFVDPTSPRSVLKVHNPDSAYRLYRGMDIWVQGRPGNWDILASYTLSFTDGTVDDYFDGYLANPRFAALYEGPSATDTRHAFKGSVGYRTPWGLDFGLRWQYRTGTPLWMNFQNPGDSTRNMYRSPRGTGFAFSGNAPNFNDPDTISELRNPPVTLIDFQARYDLGSALRMREKLEVALLFVNLLNNTEPTSYRDTWLRTSSNQFGWVAGRNRPLQAEVLVRLRN
jgi:hypothetical protein